MLTTHCADLSTCPRNSQRGLSLVEMMIGLAVGLIVSAAAASMMLAQLRESRKLTTETQIQQDLRAVAELMTRELRRAGYWGAPNNGIWAPGDTTDAAINPYQTVTLGPNTSAPFSTITVTTSSGQRSLIAAVTNPLLLEDGTVSTTEQRGFRLSSNAIDFFDGNAWQPITVPSLMQVTSFSITPLQQCLPLAEFSAAGCPVGTAGCTAKTLRLDIAISATARSDSSITRTANFTVNLKNAGTCP